MVTANIIVLMQVHTFCLSLSILWFMILLSVGHRYTEHVFS